MENKGLDAALLSSKEDIYYYTGYMPSEGLALVGSGKPVLFVSPLESDAQRAKGIVDVFSGGGGFSQGLLALTGAFIGLADTRGR